MVCGSALEKVLALLITDQLVGGPSRPRSADYLMTGMFAPILVNCPNPPIVTWEVSCRVDPFTWVPTICTL